ncbi:MAG: YigZ family protein [Candidatus Edwardsbacteria bacterium]|nr:YigZ family protein [Candidatus Edwardsbacteria bacterium]MBU1575674.1 YigZ family protein [Candidatus Edwardsbacteria bacterium]MBU2463765.1 YigZ family protein [Candidatus Edwardsbacteria bacterium]MBU2594066.1 YigZ family protein [Candidatus Edwardsbacteria bacterium]
MKIIQGLKQINPFIVDRRSKYAVTSFPVLSEDDFKEKIKLLLKDKKFRQADHNIVAYRIKTGDGRILEYKNDGYNSPSKETGAGVMMLEIMRKRKAENLCLVVTRWYGGVHLGADRFKHVRDATIEILK